MHTVVNTLYHVDFRCVHKSSCEVENGGDTFANLISERTGSFSAFMQHMFLYCDSKMSINIVKL